MHQNRRVPRTLHLHIGQDIRGQLESLSSADAAVRPDPGIATKGLLHTANGEAQTQGSPRREAPKQVRELKDRRQADSAEIWNSLVLHFEALWALADESPRAQRHIRGLALDLARTLDLLGKAPADSSKP